jgi:hypothetical protein
MLPIDWGFVVNALSAIGTISAAVVALSTALVTALVMAIAFGQA